MRLRLNLPPTPRGCEPGRRRTRTACLRPLRIKPNHFRTLRRRGRCRKRGGSRPWPDHDGSGHSDRTREKKRSGPIGRILCIGCPMWQPFLWAARYRSGSLPPTRRLARAALSPDLGRASPAYLVLLRMEVTAFHVRLAAYSSLWPCSSPHGGRPLTGILLCGARTFLSPGYPGQRLPDQLHPAF